MNDVYTAIILTLIILAIVLGIVILFFVHSLIDYAIYLICTKIEKNQKGVKHNA